MAKLMLKFRNVLLQEVPLEGPAVTIGRAPGSDIVIDNLGVSHQHAVVQAQDGHFVLEDLGSVNGTLVNGGRISGPRELRDGDQITIVKHTLLFQASQPAGASAKGPAEFDVDRTMHVPAGTVPGPAPRTMPDPQKVASGAHAVSSSGVPHTTPVSPSQPAICPSSMNTPDSRTNEHSTRVTKFTPLSPEEIRAEARRLLQGQQAMAQAGWLPAFVMFCVAFVLLLVPVIGPILFVGGVIAAIMLLVQGLSGPKVNEQQLAGQCYKMRYTTRGNCPICGAIILLFPGSEVDSLKVDCPACSAPLAYDRVKGAVSPGPAGTKADVDQATKKCPACAEYIKLEALVCRFCGHKFEKDEVCREVENYKQRQDAAVPDTARLPNASQEKLSLGLCPKCDAYCNFEWTTDAQVCNSCGARFPRAAAKQKRLEELEIADLRRSGSAWRCVWTKLSPSSAQACPCGAPRDYVSAFSDEAWAARVRRVKPQFFSELSSHGVDCGCPACVVGGA